MRRRRMAEGWNTMPDGEEVFYISTPSAGLWATKAKLDDPARRRWLRLRGFSRRSTLVRSAFFSYPVPRTGTESARTITRVGKLAVP